MSSNYVALALEGSSEAEILKNFYSITPESIHGYSATEMKRADNILFDILHNTTVDDIVDILNFVEIDSRLITPANIPQFSSLDVIDSIIDIVDANPGTKYANIGYYFNKDGNETSWSKYGENHYKITAALGLVDASLKRSVTHLGLSFRELPDKVKEDVRIKLFLRIPIILMIMKVAKDKELNVSAVMAASLSPSTVTRRRPNIKRLVDKLLALSLYKGNYLKNIVWK